MDPQLVIFAIESAIRLGIKVNEVLLDSISGRDLVLPLGALFDDIDKANAADYFIDHPELVTGDGAYVGATAAERLAAYKAIVAVNRTLGRADGAPDAREVIQRLHAFEQYGKGFGPKHPVRRILGTVVEIGIDWFATHPDAMGKDSSARRIVHAFVLRLDDVDFAEGAPVEIAGAVLTAALHTLDENVTLLDDDARLHALLRGITGALIAEIDGAGGDAAERLARENLVQRVGSSVLRGAAGAFTDNIDLFLPGDGTARTLVESTLAQVMAGVRDQPDLFTNESLELIFRSGLRAVGENAALFSDRKALQALIQTTTGALTDATGRSLFARETVAAVVASGLGVAGEHAATLVDADDPRGQLLARAVGGLAVGLSAQLGAAPSLTGLLSREHLVELTEIVFTEVARNPEALVGDDGADPRTRALAQLVGSISAALGSTPERLVDGDGLQHLVQIGLATVVRNADVLDLGDADPKTNLLFRAIHEVAAAVLAEDGHRRLIGRQGFADLIEVVLPVVSANLEPLRATNDPIIQRTVAQALQLANGALRGRTDGGNIVPLIHGLLAAVLWGDLDPADSTHARDVALDILRAA